ncbi:hypothetical protein [Streptomyces sp. F001]|uniref:hypothetical protein n=1 Tax=Streptomyces sp. F001 TaxID=1510026 RepID=UPI0013EE4F5B|nr:hypothetical protein [Streptomyces sp. F001]
MNKTRKDGNHKAAVAREELVRALAEEGAGGTASAREIRQCCTSTSVMARK